MGRLAPNSEFSRLDVAYVDGVDFSKFTKSDEKGMKDDNLIDFGPGGKPTMSAETAALFKSVQTQTAAPKPKVSPILIGLGVVAIAIILFIAFKPKN